jgi:hypothetical protein
LRTLLRALGTKNEARYNLKIVDNGAPREDRPRREERDHHTDESPAADAPADDTGAPADEPTAPPSDDDNNQAEEDLFATLGNQEEDHSDVVSKTRKELEELDDLDV